MTLTLVALPGIPHIQPGDDLVSILLEALRQSATRLQAHDVLVITSKIVSKAEGRYVDLADVSPSAEALRLAQITQKDPRIVELVLRESAEVSRSAPNILVTRHRLGFVCANAGIDQSNLGKSDETVLLLPADPDASAERLRTGLQTDTGVRDIGIVISDSHGRPFRIGNVGVAVGVAGLPAVIDLRGQIDLFGRVLRVSIQGYADEIASAANLLSGEGSEGLPVVLVRGLTYPTLMGRASDFNRKPEHDLYR